MTFLLGDARLSDNRLALKDKQENGFERGKKNLIHEKKKWITAWFNSTTV